jgi:hypothetical protein
LAEDPSAYDLIYVHKYFQIFPDFIRSLFYKLQNMPARAATTLGGWFWACIIVGGRVAAACWF